jgi:hypothetical protein
MAERDDDRLVPDEIEPDAPASAEEVAASERLRDALAGAERGAPAGALGVTPELDLALALRAAWDPSSIADDERRAVLDATPSAEEQSEAARLRDALADMREAGPGAPSGAHLATALRAAFSPTALEEVEHRAIVARALATGASRGAEVIALRRRSTTVRVAFGLVAGGLALAASITLVVTSAPPHGDEAPLARARTTQPLFNEPFKAGETSARIDRIASARASDFRDNRFSKWGVR